MAKATVSEPLGARFWFLWTAAVGSGLGNGAVATAFPLLAARLTNDARLVVGVSIAGYLPWLLFGLPAGVLGDRYRPARLVGIVEGARSVVLVAFGILVAMQWRPIALLYVVVFLVTSGDTVFTGMTNAIVPRLVPRSHLARANGALLGGQTGSENVIGPAIGGALFVVWAALPFVLDGASFVLSGALALLAVRGLAGHTAALGGSGPATAPVVPTSFRSDLRAGLSYFKSSKVLRTLLVLIAGFALCQSIAVGPLVLFALRTLHLSSAGYGLLIGVSSVGNVLGSLVAGRIVSKVPPQRVLPMMGFLVSVGYLTAGLASNAVVVGAALALEAIAVAVGIVAHVTLRQRLIDPAMLGRAGNTFRTATMGIMPIGALIGGILAQSVSLRAPLLTAAGLQLVVVVLAGPLLAKRLRDERGVLVGVGDPGRS